LGFFFLPLILFCTFALLIIHGVEQLFYLLIVNLPSTRLGALPPVWSLGLPSPFSPRSFPLSLIFYRHRHHACRIFLVFITFILPSAFDLYHLPYFRLLIAFLYSCLCSLPSSTATTTAVFSVPVYRVQDYIAFHHPGGVVATIVLWMQPFRKHTNLF
jgi:hypothetical protein